MIQCCCCEVCVESGAPSPSVCAHGPAASRFLTVEGSGEFYLRLGHPGCGHGLSPSSGCSWQTTAHWSGRKPDTAATADPTVEGTVSCVGRRTQTMAATKPISHQLYFYRDIKILLPRLPCVGSLCGGRGAREGRFHQFHTNGETLTIFSQASTNVSFPAESMM